MAPSYRSIDYSLRPGKYVERRMLSEALRKLHPFAAIDSYRYIGMGSIWFTDFAHFHRTLGITDMVSIEREAQHKARFEFNKPFASIELRFKSTTVELPQLDWSIRSITWLDYDDRLVKSMLADARVVAGRACPGSVLILSAQVEGPPLAMKQDEDGEETEREVDGIEDLRQRYGAGSVPNDATDADLKGWALATLVRKMFVLEIEDEIAKRNAGRPPNQKLEFRQFVAFEYADGAKMTTIGGIIIDQGQQALLQSCGFDALPFYRGGADAVRLTVPILTPREMRFLDAKLPVLAGQELLPEPIPGRDAASYAALYRYLPNFSPLEN